MRVPPDDAVRFFPARREHDDRERCYRNLRASLKPGGRVAVIDFRMESPEGPPRAARIAARLSEAGRSGRGRRR